MSSIALVVVQMVALVALLWPWNASRWNAWGWVAIAAALAFIAWTIAHNRLGNFGVLPEPRANARLVTTGPYAYLRHPMYFGVLLFALGCALGWSTPVHWVAAGALAVVLDVKARREERFLRERFPDYRDYAARTPRLIPRPSWSRPR